MSDMIVLHAESYDSAVSVSLVTSLRLYWFGQLARIYSHMSCEDIPGSGYPRRTSKRWSLLHQCAVVACQVEKRGARACDVARHQEVVGVQEENRPGQCLGLATL